MGNLESLPSFETNWIPALEDDRFFDEKVDDIANALEGRLAKE